MPAARVPKPDARFPLEFWLLAAAALLTRLWSIDSPPELIWDEKHYAYFMGSYLNGSWMMDVHPPLGRMLLALVAWFEGYGRELMSQQVGAPWVRVLPALAGAALVPAVWGIVRALGGGRPAAALAATAVLADLGFLVESRFVLPDSLLLLALLGTVGCALASERAVGPRAHLLWLLGAAVAAGAAVSIKWTGLAALPLLVGRLAYGAWRAHRTPAGGVVAVVAVAAVAAVAAVRTRLTLAGAAWRGALTIGVATAIYLGSFAGQIALLKEAGREDRWMSPAFTKTLEGSVNHEHGSRIPFVAAVIDMHRAMNEMNASILALGGGLSSSPWYSWPITKHSITLLSRGGMDGPEQRWIILTGSPAVWWGALVGMLTTLIALMMAHVARWAAHDWAKRLRARREALAFLVLAYGINYLPFALISRATYLYHYLAPLLFSLMIAAIGTEAIAGWTWRKGRVAWGGVLVVIVAVFAYLAPIAYGWPISRDAARHRIVLLERRLPD